MTLLGKIFTGLILVMSVLFLGFAIAVYATHVNWRKLASNPSPAAGEQLGLQQQVERQTEINRQLKEQQENLLAAINLEQAARRMALAALETKLRARTEQLEGVQQQLEKLIATEGTTAGALVTAQNELTAITEEVKNLRDTVRAAQQDADAKFAQLVKMSDELNQMRITKSELEARQQPLQDSLAGLRDALTKLGVNFEMNQDGTVRTDADRLPPNVRGVVLDVGEKNLVEISVGADDGILTGHKLDVYREGAYLGKVIVVKTSPDRAVAEIIPDYKRGTIRKGDRVATKFS